MLGRKKTLDRKLKCEIRYETFKYREVASSVIEEAYFRLYEEGE